MNCQGLVDRTVARHDVVRVRMYKMQVRCAFFVRQFDYAVLRYEALANETIAIEMAPASGYPLRAAADHRNASRERRVGETDYD